MSGPNLNDLAANADPGITDRLQNGVIGAGDLLISSISINGTTAALTFTLASGVAWVKNAAGLLVRVVYTGQSYTLTPSTLPTALNAEIVGVEIDSSGTVTLNAGAPFSPSGSLIPLNEGHTPAVTSGRLRIADIAILNSVGSYLLIDGGAASQGNNWLDRRPWARGAYAIASNPNSTNYATSSASAGLINAALQLRIECTGAPLLANLLISAVRNNDGGGTGVNSTFFGPWADGALVSTGFWSGGTAVMTHPVANSNQYLNISWPIVPGGGGLSVPASHLIAPAWWTNAGTSVIDNAVASGVGVLFSVRENVSQIASNGNL